MLSARRAARSGWLALPLLVLAGCSTVPEPGFPPFVEHRVTATYQLDGPGPHRIPVPSSDPWLVVEELRCEPADTVEVFEAGQRYLVPPPTCQTLVLRCRYRDYQNDERGAPRAPRSLFAGAATVRISP